MCKRCKYVRRGEGEERGGREGRERGRESDTFEVLCVLAVAALT